MPDVAFTSLMLATPPLNLPDRLRPTVNRVAARLARSFVARYRRLAKAPLDDDELRWFTVLHSLRVLLEVDRRAAEGQPHSAHPWFGIAPTVRGTLDQLIGT